MIPVYLGPPIKDCSCSNCDCANDPCAGNTKTAPNGYQYQGQNGVCVLNPIYANIQSTGTPKTLIPAVTQDTVSNTLTTLQNTITNNKPLFYLGIAGLAYWFLIKK